MSNQIISVALPTPLRKNFDYSIDEEFKTSLKPGCRVRVNFGHRELIGIIVSSVKPAKEKQNYKPILEQLDLEPIFTADIFALCLWAANYYQHPLGEVLAAAMPTALRKGLPPQAQTELSWQLSDFGKGLPDDALKRAKKQQLCLNIIRTHQSASAKFLAEQGISRQIINTLVDKKLLQPSRIRVATTQLIPKKTVQLNLEQQQAYSQLLVNNSKPTKPTLLFGVTGSGKTEVYLARINDVISAGQQVLVLVPEINLTPQFVQRFKQRLGLTVEAMHSGMTEKQRLDIWVRAKEGSLTVVIGTRSALFTPFKNLGLIVVDEEHANSLKQHEGFRYSARDCAIWRAQHLKIPLILGSATPALESYNNARDGRYYLAALSKRAQNATAPNWNIADIRGQTVQAGISELALAKIATALARQEQILVFVNRLGYAPNLQCHNCGWHAQCAQCDANQTLYLQRQTLRCSHCDTQVPLPKVCPSCQSTHLQTTGQGTEQVSDYLSRYFDTTPVLRMDSEATQSRQKLTALLQQINTGEACIIVGTQLMAKGHDFANLSLVVIVNADDGLISSSYRAVERTAQLLTQVGGRAGRSDKQGTVLVQTHYPEQPLFNVLAGNNYQAIVDQELIVREQLALPPFSYEAQILTASPNPYNSEQCLMQLQSSYQWTCNSIGPMPATLARKAGQFRSVLLFRSAQRKTLHQNIQHAVNWLDKHAKKHKCRWSIDVDPIEHQ